MVDVRPETERLANYKSGASVAPGRWVPAVNRAKWQEKSIEGQGLYDAQLSIAEVRARRASSIAKIPDSEWRATTVAKGKDIIGTRMTAAADKQVAGWRPYGTALEGVTLVARTTSPETNVDNRVKPIVRAMVDTKKTVKGW
jgi:hypothetical protein